MSFHLRKTKHSSSVCVNHLNDSRYDPLIVALIRSILEGTDITASILKNLLSGLGVKANLAMRYALAHYDPSNMSEITGFHTNNINNTSLLNILDAETEYNKADIVDVFTAYTMYSPKLAILPFLINIRKYQIGGSKNTQILNYPDNLDFIEVIPCDPSDDTCLGDTVIDWSTTAFATKVVVSEVYQITEIALHDDDSLPADKLNYICIEYTRWVFHDSGDSSSDTYLGPVYVWRDIGVFREYISPDDFFQSMPYGTQMLFVRFEVPSVDNDLHFWYYDISEGRYPSLEPSQITSTDHLLPAIPLRIANVNECTKALQQTEQFKIRQRFLNYFNIDILALNDEMLKNSKIGEMDYIFVVFGADLASKCPATALYIDKILDLYYQRGLNTLAFSNDLNLVTSNSDETVHAVSTRHLPGDVRNIISYSSVNKRTYKGKIKDGKIGSIKLTATKHTCKVRIQTTRQSVTEYRLINFCFTTRTRRHYHVTYTPLDSYVGDGSVKHNCYFPIAYGLAKQLSLRYRNWLYKDVSLIFINAVKKRKQKWYETAFVRFVFAIVIAIIVIWSGQAWLSALAKAASAGAVALLEFVATTVAISVIVDYAVKWLVDELGPKFGFIATVLLIVAAAYGAEFNFAGLFRLEAQGLLQLANAVIIETNNVLVNKQEEILDKYHDFEDRLEEKYKELKTVEELLNFNHIIDPIRYVAPKRYRLIPAESVDSFLTRTIQLADNSFALVHSAIPNYAEIMHTLPKTVDMKLYNTNIG